MINFAVYTDIGNSIGRIEYTGVCPDGEMNLYPQLGQQVMEVDASVADNTHYIDLQSMATVARQPMGLFISATEIAVDQDLTVSGIPEGTTLLYAGGETPISGTLTWSAAHSCITSFIFLHPLYLEELIRVTVY